MNSRDNIRAKKATVRLSQWVLAYLKEEHRIPLTQIGATIEIGETFLSKVLNGKEAFSMKRLLQAGSSLPYPSPAPHHGGGAPPFSCSLNKLAMRHSVQPLMRDSLRTVSLRA